MSKRFLYYIPRALPSAILFGIAVVLFYFGLIALGYWILASVIGILGREAHSMIPARIAVIALVAGIVFWGVAMVFGRKQEKTTVS